MLVYRNADGVLGQIKFGNHCATGYRRLTRAECGPRCASLAAAVKRHTHAVKVAVICKIHQVKRTFAPKRLQLLDSQFACLYPFHIAKNRGNPERRIQYEVQKFPYAVIFEIRIRK